MAKEYPYYGASGVIDAVEDFLFDEPLILVAEDGANLLSRSTSLAFIARGKYWVNNHAHIMRPLIGPIEYWEAALQLFDFTPLVSGSAQPKLTLEAIGNVWLPVPPERERHEIAEHVAMKNSRIDVSIAKANEAIKRLIEYRQSVTSYAISGKFDVRAAA